MHSPVLPQIFCSSLWYPSCYLLILSQILHWIINMNEIVQNTECQNYFVLGVKDILRGSNHEMELMLDNTKYPLNDIASLGMEKIV